MQNITLMLPQNRRIWKSKWYNTVFAIDGNPDGVMWFGTWGGGVSRYDGKTFVNFTTKDGLAGNNIFAIHRDPDGVMWFGTTSGPSRYDGRGFVNFTTKDGLVHNGARAIHCDPDGAVWFGTWGGGVSRYDGKGFVNFTTKDGLGDSRITAIHRDPHGIMWFGTRGGVSRYNGKGARWDRDSKSLAERDPRPEVLRSEGSESSARSIWTPGQFVNFTEKDGLAGNAVTAIHHDPPWNHVVWDVPRWRGLSV